MIRARLSPDWRSLWTAIRRKIRRLNLMAFGLAPLTIKLRLLKKRRASRFDKHPACSTKTSRERAVHRSDAHRNDA